MRARFTLCCLLILTTAATVRAEADFIDAEALRAADLVKFYQLRLPLGAGQEIVASHLVDDQHYLFTNDGYVFAIQAYTGTIRWTRQVTRGGYNVRKPAHAGNRVIFVTPPAIIQYNRYTGAPIRRTELEFPAASPPVSDGFLTYLGGVNRRLYAFDINQDWETWKVRTDGQVVSQPTLADIYLYFATDAGTVYSCTAEDKVLRWKTRVSGPVTADLVIDENGLYVASRDQSLYLLSPKLNGGRRWRVRFSGQLAEPPVSTPEVAFQYCAADGLVAINTAEDAKVRVRWTISNGRALLTLDEEHAYLLTRDHCIAVADLKTGAVKHTVPAPGFTFAMPSPSDPAMLIASRDGRVFCVRKRGAKIVSPEDIQRALAGAPAAEEAPEEAAETPTAALPPQTSLNEEPIGPPIGGKSKVTKEYAGN